MKPILMNIENVRALLEGRKTVTRRVVKFKGGQNPAWSGYIADGTVLYGSNNIPAAKASYHPGDILWVRETWTKDFDVLAWAEVYLYRADYNSRSMRFWKPSIHMPREAARIFLRVTGVRAERLQEITSQQIDAEGCCEYAYDAKTGKPAPSGPSWFRILWEKTIKPVDLPVYGWEANPWVWVIEFERISKEEAEQ